MSKGEEEAPRPPPIAPPMPNLLMFAPETWGEAEKFAKFYGPTYPLRDLQKRNVSGVANHIHKALAIYALVQRLRPNLNIDRDELDTRGFTGAQHSKEFSAVFKSAILELYSAVDCAAKTVIAIYENRSRNLGSSTRGLFQNFEKITEPFPEEIKRILRAVDWYHDLRVVRDELTHREIGHCSLDHKTGQVNYLLHGLVHEDRPLHIPDIFSWFEQKFHQVNQFTGILFRYLNTTLGAGEVMAVCGMTQGRMLIRYVNPAQVLTFDNGRCGSRQWIDNPAGPTCPFKPWCGAYWGRPMQPGAPTSSSEEHNPIGAAD